MVCAASLELLPHTVKSSPTHLDDDMLEDPSAGRQDIFDRRSRFWLEGIGREPARQLEQDLCRFSSVDLEDVDEREDERAYIDAVGLVPRRYGLLRWLAEWTDIQWAETRLVLEETQNELGASVGAFGCYIALGIERDDDGGQFVGDRGFVVRTRKVVLERVFRLADGEEASLAGLRRVHRLDELCDAVRAESKQVGRDERTSSY